MIKLKCKAIDKQQFIAASAVTYFNFRVLGSWVVGNVQSKNLNKSNIR